MSTKPLQLEGIIREDRAPNDDAVRRLRLEKQQLEDDLRIARQELDDLRIERERMERSIRNLRTQLSPLHRALRAVFGEIELAVGEEEYVATVATVSGVASQPADQARWQSYKQNFPGVPALCIDALLVNDSMSIPQVAAFVKRAYSTTKDALLKLKNAGALVSDGGRYRLNR